MDLRQSLSWGKYLSKIGWKVEKIGGIQILIRPVPLLNCSLIKIQRPENPIPFQKIDDLARKNKALFVLIEPQIKNYNSDLFSKNKFKITKSMLLTHTTSIHIDLKQPETKLWASISENARRNIRKALNSKLKIETVFLKEEPDDQQFKQFFKLLHNLTKLKKFWAPGYEEFHYKMQAFKDNSLLLFAHTLDQPTPIAAIWIAFFDKKIWYMHTGITEEGYDKMANYLLVWEAFKLGKKLGAETFDFEGIYDPRFPKERKKWINFSEFKKRFHGTLVNYPPAYIKFYNPIFRFFYLCNQLI